ncbi:protein of unknown function [bacterium A37T11]|nr:protein of unknown function [bacterium A37T11]
MKKMLIFGFLLLVIASCKKSSLDSFELEKSYPDADSALTGYADNLYGSAAGWEFQWEAADASRIYTGYLDFEKGAKTARFAAPITESASTVSDVPVLLRVIRANPTLSFVQGSIVSNFVETTNNLDSVFTFKSAGTDTVTLVGDNYGSKLTLVRVDQSVADIYGSGALLKVRKAMEAVKSWTRYFKRLTVGNKSYDIQINSDRSLISLSYEDAGVIKTVSSNYTIYRSSLKFLEEMSLPGLSLTGLDNLQYDESLNKISGDVNSAAMSISNEIAPVKYDKTMASYFLSHLPQGTIAESYTGFTVDGVTDGYGVKSIPGFSSMVFIPKFSNADYGAFRFWLGTGYGAYYPAITPSVGANGNLLFEYIGFAGSPPASAISILQNIIKTISQEEGFYVIKPDPDVNAYELVSVNGGNKWIRLE